jgi:hypothetical protein
MVDSTSLHLLGRMPGLTTVNVTEAKLSHTDIPFLAQMPHLAILHLRGSDIVIEDLEPLAMSPTLKSLSLEITATSAERQSFEQAHKNLRVVWNIYDSWPGIEREASEPLEVAQVLIKRWKAETEATDSESNRESLDFANFQLTLARLRRLPREIFAHIEVIDLGGVDSPATALELIDVCPKLRYLDARMVPFSGNDIERIAKKSSLESLWLQQGQATATDFCKLALLPELYSLEIYGSTFTVSEATAIQNDVEHNGPAATVDIFPGFDDEERDKEIQPVDGRNDNPFGPR